MGNSSSLKLDENSFKYAIDKCMWDKIENIGEGSGKRFLT